MRWLGRNLIIAALGLLTTTGVANAAESLQLLLADTTVNHVEQGEAFLVWDGVGEFLAAEPELIKWRVRAPFPEPVLYDDMPYYRISDLAGATASLGTQGSLAWLAGKAYAAREIADGFAVAQVADIPNVRVYLDNHEIGRSDEQGRILLPSLRPYESNRIRIAAEDLPLGAQVDQLELQVAPYFRSGTVVDFPVRTSRQLVLNAVRENGEPVPEGAVVNIDGREDWSIVGIDGMIYLAGLEGTTRLVVRWLEESCEMEVRMPDSDAPLPSIGVQVCEEVQ